MDSESFVKILRLLVFDKIFSVVVLLFHYVVNNMVMGFHFAFDLFDNFVYL